MSNYKDTTRKKKKEAKKNMTKKQIKKCHAIIHTAAVTSAAAGAVPIPMADAIPISVAQTTMVMSLGGVFDLEISESVAKGLFSSAAATLIGRNLVKFIPVVGWVISAVVAAGVTEAIGWCVAVDFAKANYTDGYQDGCKDTSKTYEAKFADLAKKFADDAETWQRDKEKWEQTQAKKDEYIRKCLKYIKDLEKERDSLHLKNKELSEDNQELLARLYEIHAMLSTT